MLSGVVGELFYSCIYSFIYSFIHLFIYPFIIYLLTYVSIRLFAHVLKTYSSIYFFIFFICRVHLLVHRARLRSWPTRFFSLLHLFIYLPMCLFVRLLLHLQKKTYSFTYLCVYLFLHLKKKLIHLLTYVFICSITPALKC